jgi:hypothetical protein
MEPNPILDSFRKGGYMINKSLLVSALCLCATLAFAQTAPVQTPQNYTYPNNPNNSQQGAGGILFSNQTGQSFSPNQLAAQLQNLRDAVDQTLPLLAAFNQSYSNSVNGGRQTVGGALSGIVSDVLHRNQSSSQTSAGNQSALSATNLLSMLHGLLNTNSNGATGAAPANAEDLKALQADLQPVVTILQRLNVSPNPNPAGMPYNNGTATVPPYNQGISPTGR